MGFYIRKSVSVGPFRFNLSKSGVGLSLGVKGFRVGAGPRGNYVHMGRGGLYFRTSLPRGSRSQASPRSTVTPGIVSGPPGDQTLGDFLEVESAATVELTDSSSERIVQQIGEKASVPRMLPWAVACGVATLVLARFAGAPAWLLAFSIPLVLVLCVIANRRDTVARAVVVMYDLDDAATEAYGQLHGAFETLQAAGRLWHVEGSANVHDGKYHAGASSVIRRNVVSVQKGQPPILKTNVEAVLLQAGRQLLAFMPDRVLVFDGSAVGGFEYKNLRVEVGQTKLIEDVTPPSDARIVGTTWRYVSKGGGPDRRFANNRQLPVALYEELSLRSGSGLNELFQCSRLGVGGALQSAVARIARIAEARRRGVDEIAKPEKSEARGSLESIGPKALKIAREKSSGWEYLLFFQAWIDEVARRSDQIRAYRLAEYGSQTRLDSAIVIPVSNFADWSEEKMRELQQLIGSANVLFNTSIQEAVGKPGEPGNAGAIVDVARELGQVLDGMLRWAKEVKSAILAEPFERMGSHLALFVNDVLDQFERFPAESLRKCEEALARPATGNAVPLNLTMTFRLTNAEGYQKELEAARKRSEQM